MSNGKGTFYSKLSTTLGLPRAIFWHLYSLQFLSLQGRVVLSACDFVQMDWSELRMKPNTWPSVTAAGARSVTSIIGKSKRRTSLSFILPESLDCWSTHEMKFIELYGTVGFIVIQHFSYWGENDLWSDVLPAINGLVCLSLIPSFRRRGSNFK